jgi:hypothetical protein
MSKAFTIIKNGVDARLSIVRHNESGFYNISQTATLVHELKVSENRNQSENAPQPTDWLRIKDSKELFAVVAEFQNCNVEDLKFKKLKVRNEYKGTYVHPKVYDMFLAWLDKRYALLIADVLESHHASANRALLQEKDDCITRLEKTVAEVRDEARKERDEARKERIEARKRDEEQKAELAKLYSFAKTTVEQVGTANAKLDVIQDELTETKEEVQLAKTYLVEKSLTSTMNPSDENDHHCFGVVVRTTGDGIELKYVTGQKKYVTSRIKKLRTLGYETAISPFYNANGIDLRQNISSEFIKRRRELLRSINEKIAADDQLFNDALLDEIRQYNTIHSGSRRTFADEKQSTLFVRARDIPVTFDRLSVTYVTNPHMSYEDVISIITDVNNATQESPLPSDASDEE